MAVFTWSIRLLISVYANFNILLGCCDQKSNTELLFSLQAAVHCVEYIIVLLGPVPDDCIRGYRPVRQLCPRLPLLQLFQLQRARGTQEHRLSVFRWEDTGLYANYAPASLYSNYSNYSEREALRSTDSQFSGEHILACLPTTLPPLSIPTIPTTAS